jgi:hypothetical protein
MKNVHIKSVNNVSRGLDHITILRRYNQLEFIEPLREHIRRTITPLPLGDNTFNYFGSGRCPYCMSTSILSTNDDDMNFGNGHAWIKINCQSCRSSWFEEYKLTGWSPDE